MFLLVSVRHIGAHPGEHQHGVSIQIFLGKTFLRISRIRKIPLTWILARVFVYVPPFISQILDFIYWTVFIFISIYFEWRDFNGKLVLYVRPWRRKAAPSEILVKNIYIYLYSRLQNQPCFFLFTLKKAG